MNAKISVFIICVELIIYLLLYNWHDYTLMLTRVNYYLILFNFVILLFQTSEFCIFVQLYFNKVFPSKHLISFICATDTINRIRAIF